MKKIMLNSSLILLLLTLTSSSFATVNFSLTGTVKNQVKGKIYLQKFYNKMLTVIDSAVIVNGKFSFKAPAKLPELYGITLDPTVDLLYPFYVFLENSHITLEVDSANSYKNAKVTGSSTHDLYEWYKINSKNISIGAFIDKYPKSIVPTYILYRNFSYRLSPEQLEENIAKISPELHDTHYYQLLKGLPTALRQNGVRKLAVDFEQWDTEGKSYKLHEHLGKYLLIDFWAAWCPPCRAEIPAIKILYEKYEGKGLDILGVSFDKSKTAWLKAIADDGIPWKNVSDLKFWNNEVGKLYGIRLIPANVLIDPNGIIVARNLHGKELERKLEDIFGQ